MGEASAVVSVVTNCPITASEVSCETNVAAASRFSGSSHALRVIKYPVEIPPTVSDGYRPDCAGTQQTAKSSSRSA